MDTDSRNREKDPDYGDEKLQKTPWHTENTLRTKRFEAESGKPLDPTRNSRPL